VFIIVKNWDELSENSKAKYKGILKRLAEKNISIDAFRQMNIKQYNTIFNKGKKGVKKASLEGSKRLMNVVIKDEVKQTRIRIAIKTEIYKLKKSNNEKKEYMKEIHNTIHKVKTPDSKRFENTVNEIITSFQVSRKDAKEMFEKMKKIKLDELEAKKKIHIELSDKFGIPLEDIEKLSNMVEKKIVNGTIENKPIKDKLVKKIMTKYHISKKNAIELLKPLKEINTPDYDEEQNEIYRILKEYYYES